MLDNHVSAEYQELDNCVRNGITLIIGGVPETFNLVCFFVADLCFIKDVIGEQSLSDLSGFPT